MIKVLVEKPVPKTDIICMNCGSVLEYGNADLSIDDDSENQFAMYAGYHQYYFRCPVCGCKVSASWINKKKE